MASQGNPLPRNQSTSDSSESSLFPNPIPEEKWKEHLYSMENEVINDLRRHTRAYVKSIGGLPIIPNLPKREYKKKTVLYWKTQFWLEIWKNWQK